MSGDTCRPALSTRVNRGRTTVEFIRKDACSFGIKIVICNVKNQLDLLDKKQHF